MGIGKSSGEEPKITTECMKQTFMDLGNSYDDVESFMIGEPLSKSQF